MTPKPDTSPQAIARVLRELLAQIDELSCTEAERTGDRIDYTPAECEARSLANALKEY